MRPMLSAAIGLPASAAARAKRKPEKTISDEPITSIASARASASIAAVTRSRGTLSPKNTTSGFKIPPQAQLGTSNAEKSTASRSASPSGASFAVRPAKSGLRSSSSCCRRARGSLCPQLMQRTISSRPCRSITRRWPAAWCSRSTFCVTSSSIRPSASRRASAKCAPFGRARRKRGHPTRLRAQYRCRARASTMKV